MAPGEVQRGRGRECARGARAGSGSGRDFRRAAGRPSWIAGSGRGRLGALVVGREGSALSGGQGAAGSAQSRVRPALPGRIEEEEPGQEEEQSGGGASLGLSRCPVKVSD
ncbi:hypothetical protein NDU88_008457 [Pleurodeles waltl]|uniref:Uncharacterized protein n=1 Tax=Pleurodeles waltl TaxID=8319 RepID=A0AAV7N6R4_PLEWA|nr:hypothetical protein NDU88_008457 [Pleurodeles waltl]